MSLTRNILVIDLEATCWEGSITPSNMKNEIIEIGITPIRLLDYKIGEPHSIIVRPTTSIVSEFCTKLTTLTPEFVSTGVSFKDAIREVDYKYSPQDSVWASFGEYDKKMFVTQCHDENVRYPFSNWWLNVKALFIAKYGRSMGCEQACEYAGITFTGTRHRGVDDSKNIAQLLVKLLK